MSKFEMLRKRPFNLKDTDIQWVRSTLENMTMEEKAGQLFCLIARRGDEAELEDTLRVMMPGGFMYRPMSLERCVSFTRLLRERCPIPMLIAANLEKGGNGVVTEGTLYHAPMGIAAGDQEIFAQRLGTICGQEAAAVGANWAFAPIVDIDFNFRNPITNVRTYGSDPDRVRRMGLAYLREVQKYGVAGCLKHFPGDGCDERDQHLVTSVNSLSCEEWDATYGAIYRAGIDAGALTVMCGHIMQPAWSKRLDPSLAEEDILPASLSPELVRGLLREHCGFNGLVVTDATTMAGYTIPMPRKEAVPRSIAAGVDMFLFTRNLEEDYEYMLDGIRSGVITPERLDEAVIRILGVKAALGLHKDPPLPTVVSASRVVGSPEFAAWAEECAQASVTLVKKEPGVFPITPQRYPRVLYYPIESASISSYGGKAGACEAFEKMLREEGFSVDVFVPDNFLEGQARRAEEILENYDLVIYLANMSTKSNQTCVRIEWQQPMGANCPHYINSVPTVFLSVENPYHLLDVPRVKTYVNAYNSGPAVLSALLDKITGRTPFQGISPVDAFCGKWDTRL